LRVLDVSDPTNPTEVGFYDFNTPEDATGVVVAGDYVYVANYDRYVYPYDAGLFVLRFVPPPKVSVLTPSPGSVFYHGDSLLVRADVTVGGLPLIDGQVMGRIHLNNSFSMNFDLYDDGSHEDHAANDGVYATRITLYDPLTMPAGNYTITVTAIGESGSDSDSTNINVTSGGGAPTVALEVSGPSAPDFFADEQVTLIATLTYPDSSIHTDTAVTVTVTTPDLSVTHLGLTNVSANTWQSSYTFPVGQGGTYYLNARADPPPSTHFVDGFGGAQVYVYIDELEITVNSSPGTIFLYGVVPLSVCVTAGGMPVSGATVDAEINLPVIEDGGTLVEVDGNGCYEGSYVPTHSGTHNVTYTAEKPGYLGTARDSSFEVSTQSSSLADWVWRFGNDAVSYSETSQTLVGGAASDGDYFARKLRIDRTNQAINVLVDFASWGEGVAGAVRTVSTEGWKVLSIHMLPGYRIAVESALSNQAALKMLGKSVVATVLKQGSGYVVSDALTKAPMRFYATEGDPDKDVRRPILDYIRDSYQAQVPGEGSLEAHFRQVLDPAIVTNQSDLQLNTIQAIYELDPMTVEEEQAYIHDLALRRDANLWLSRQELKYRSNLLFLTQDKREVEDTLWLFRALVRFFVENGIKLGAGAVCDGPCAVGVDLGLKGYKFYQMDRNIEEDQRMRDMALNLMHLGYNVQAILWSNTTAGLALVADKGPLETPRGETSSIVLKRTTTGFPFYLERDVYAEVGIDNPSDGVRTLYEVKLYYTTKDGHLQLSSSLVDPLTGETRLLVELSPGQSKVVRLYLRKHNEFDDGKPREGRNIRFNLFAYTDDGAYLVDSANVPYEPEPALAATDHVSVQYLSPQATAKNTPLRLVASNGVSGTASFPLLNRVGSRPGSISYTLAIYADNPWPGPIATVISQTLPAEMTVLDAGDGVVQNGAIVWHRVIQPREIIAFHADFDYAGYGVTATLPAATMRFYDPADDAIITLTGEPLLFQTQSPLRASADASTWVAPSSVQTVAVTVNNLDASATQQGDLTLRLSTITGTNILSTTAHVSLGSLANQVYDLPYTAPNVDDGLYILQVDLSYEDLTTSVMYDLLKVAWRRIYLPVVVRNR